MVGGPAEPEAGARATPAARWCPGLEAVGRPGVALAPASGSAGPARGGMLSGGGTFECGPTSSGSYFTGFNVTCRTSMIAAAAFLIGLSVSV